MMPETHSRRMRADRGASETDALEMWASAPTPDTGKWIGAPIGGAEVFLEIGDALDIDKELARIDKELGDVEKQVARCEAC